MLSRWAPSYWMWWFVRKRRESIDFNAVWSLKKSDALSCDRTFCSITRGCPPSNENFREAMKSNPALMDRFFPFPQNTTLILFIILSVGVSLVCTHLSSWYTYDDLLKPVGRALKYLYNHYNPHDFRVELLLDLAFLSLRLQHHQTASDCLKELRATDLTVRLPHRALLSLLSVILFLNDLLCSCRSVSV